MEDRSRVTGTGGRKALKPAPDLLAFSLRPTPPFKLSLTAWALRRRPDNVVDRWDGRTYRRVVVLENAPLEVAVTQVGTTEEPLLQVAVRGSPLPLDAESKLTRLLERVLGIGIDLRAFYRLVAEDPQLGPLAHRFRGIKPPRFPTVFEAIVNGIACQQVTLTQGIHALNRLAEGYGLTFDHGEHRSHAFPRPEEMAKSSPEDLRALGLSRQKGVAIVSLAEAIASGQLDLEGLEGAGDREALAQLLSLRGVGRWTGEYVLLRGLGRIHVFPGDDVGARNNLTRWLKLATPPDYEEIRRLLGRWSPYQGLVYFHLLLDRLASAGILS